VLEQYSVSSLTAFTGTSMAAAVISYSLYVQDVIGRSHERYLLLFTVPFVILAIFRYYLLVENAGAGEKPEEILLTDRPLQLFALGFAAVAVLAFYGGV
jgi:decaprenyl-phosphate phosphoribosyltransferase